MLNAVHVPENAINKHVNGMNCHRRHLITTLLFIGQSFRRDKKTIKVYISVILRIATVRFCYADELKKTLEITPKGCLCPTFIS